MFAPETAFSRGGSPATARFNEAGACLPRKAMPRGFPLPLTVGFNEAGACLPRKRDRGDRAARVV